jgi:hypothetical protein
VVSAAVHLGVVAALFWPETKQGPRPDKPSPPPLEISFVSVPKPAGPPGLDEPAAPVIAPPSPPHVTAPVFTIASAAASDMSDLLSDAQLAGAARTGDGGGGGGCDMARAVQRALQRDPLVRTAVAEAHRLGKAILLWNGDWVQAGGQDGKGLSAVREAITWEVAFAPTSCRMMRMHGLVLLALTDGVTRFAVGTNEWRWADLLGVR